MSFRESVVLTAEASLRRDAAPSRLRRSRRLEHELRRGVVEGTLYPLLRRLESQDVLTSEWRTDEGSPRRYYVLSPHGWQLYERLTPILAQPERHRGSPRHQGSKR
jgi:DNA-binding PadR family transcriptional regulator